MTAFSRFRRSISWRIGAVFVLLLLLTMAAAVLTIGYFVKVDLERGTRQEMIGAMKRMETDVLRMRDEVLLFAQLAARATQVREQAADVGATTLQITLIEESRAKGIEIAEFTAGKPGTPAWEVMRRGFSGMATVDYVLDGTGPSRLKLIAVAPIGGDEKERRIVTASANLGREFLRRERAALGGDISLIEKGGLIASSSTCLQCMECLREIMTDESEWRVLETGKPIYFTVDCDPEPQAAVVVPLKTFAGKTVAMTLFRSREADVSALLHTTLGLLGGGFAFTAVMAIAFALLSTRAFRPLRELTRMSVGIAEGRYGETVPVTAEDEVGDLARAFNKMSLSLKDAVSEISEWNRLLESRVDEKSRELEKVHRRMVEVEKLAAVGQLAAGVAHELNNPLSGIMGFSEVALEVYGGRPRESLAPEDFDRMIDYFRQIDALTQRCRAIILDMLTFARHHAEEATDLDLNGVMRRTLGFLAKPLEKNKVRVVTDFTGGLPVLKANELQLQQVFTNLILNAVQAMPGGGTLTVRTRLEGDALAAEVADDGVGIAPDHLNRIFEPFFTTKPVGQGTGLGLSVSYGIVQRHGGVIRVTSEPGNGSAFTVVLPTSGAA